MFKYYERKAKKQGLFVTQASGRSVGQSIAHYFHEFDVVGALILMAAFVLFLLPFSLQTYGRVTYGSPAFIAMIVIGLVLFPVFAIWEKYCARTHFIRWELFRQRTVIGACMVAIAIQFSFYCWDQYFYQFIQAVYGLNYSEAGYMVQIYNVGSCFWGVVFGLWVRYSRRIKYECLCFGLPLAFLALVPSGAVAPALYDVIRAVSAIFPFKPALDALDAALNDAGSLGGPLLHLAALTAGFGVLGRLALQRFA